MPIYEYLCQECGSAFETIVFGEEVVSCQRCRSERVDRQLSTFAVGSQSTAPAPGPCGTCGAPQQGMCRMQN